MSKTWKELLEKVVSVTGIFYPITSTVKAIADSKISKIMFEKEYDEKYKREILDNAVMDDYTNKFNNSSALHFTLFKSQK